LYISIEKISTCAIHKECENFRSQHSIEFEESGPGSNRDTETQGLKRGGGPAISVPGSRPSLAVLMAAQVANEPQPKAWPVIYNTKGPGAASEGELNSLVAYVNAYKLEFQSEESLKVLSKSTVSEEASSIKTRPLEPLVNPVTSKHPTTRETSLHAAARNPQGTTLVRYLLSINADVLAKDIFQVRCSVDSLSLYLQKIYQSDLDANPFFFRLPPFGTHQNGGTYKSSKYFQGICLQVN
jgi:hypothetical protein